VDSSGRNFVLKGFGVCEWTNTEAYMLEWPDGNGKYLWYYGYTRIHGPLETLMGEDAADRGKSARPTQAWRKRDGATVLISVMEIEWTTKMSNGGDSRL
jgi:hypothetical protein